MSAITSVVETPVRRQQPGIKEHIKRTSEDLLASLPSVKTLSAEERRGIIARYSGVLEGNFIYWMSAAHLAAKTDEAREMIRENLVTEIADCHPGMMRRFAMAAHAVPNESDLTPVYPQLCAVRSFVGRMSAPPLIAMMAFFENWIQAFMAYLADLARYQGSSDMEYTDVHGICDVTHSEELFEALDMEMAVAGDPRDPSEYLFEGVDLLSALIESMVGDSSALRYGKSVSSNVN